MTEDRVERQLAAILAADVAGYSRLMGSDEEGTLAALKGHRRALVDPKVSEHRGRIVKTTGDGMLVEFASVVDAVRCAADIQRGMVERNAKIPKEKRIELRIGINVGDIIIDRGDIFGDGVNVAARLEGLAEPGGICVSGRVQEDVQGKFGLGFVDAGEHHLKNIERPVRVFSLPASAVTAPPESRPTIGRAHWSQFRVFLGARSIAASLSAVALVAVGAWFAMKPASTPQPPLAAAGLAMVVLPFANLSGDPSQDYLADVITEELTTSLARISGSFIIARSTASTYKGKAVDAKQIGKDLGVRYVLEGSEQRSANRVRINAQLIDAETGAHLWADQFDADRADLLEMQDEIVTRLSRALQLRLVEVDAARIARAHPGDPDAEELAMRCEAVVGNSGPGSDEMSAGYDLCEQALRRDERNVRAAINLSFRFIDRVLEVQSPDRESDIRQADELVSMALAIDPNAYAAHFAKAEVLLTQKRFEEAIVEAERSLALNPSFVNAYSALCTAGSFLGMPEKAVEYADKAIRLSPRDRMLYVFHLQKGFALSLLDQDTQATEWLRRAVAGAPHWPLPQALLRSTCYDRARGGSPRNARALPVAQRSQGQDGNAVEGPAALKQSGLPGVCQAACRGAAQGGDARVIAATMLSCLR